VGPHRIATPKLRMPQLILEIEDANRASQGVGRRAGFTRTGTSEVIQDKGRPLRLELWQRPSAAGQ
jgi:RimJ/RimL family protein N-acetyltransferase